MSFRIPLATPRLGILIFVLGFCARMGPVILQHRYEDIQQPEIVRIGKELATSGRFANPFPEPTGITAICPPGYPYVLSVIYRTLGFNTHAQFVVESLSSACAAAEFALLPWLAAIFGFSRRAGLIAGLIGAGFPFFFWIETKGSYDTTETSLVFLLLLGTFAAVSRSRLRLPVWYGLLWGLLLLFSPAFVPALAVLCVIRLLDRRSQAVPEIARVAVLVVVVLLPWSIRNFREFHTLFFIRDNYGMELSLSNQANASALFDENIGGQGPYATHPFYNAGERARLIEMGEPRYFALKKQDALSWIRANPERFAKLTVQRVFFYWFPILNARWKTLWLALVTLGGLIGFVRATKIQPLMGAILASAIVFYPLPYYLIQVDVRYRYVLYPLLLLCGASLLAKACGDPTTSEKMMKATSFPG